MSRVLVAGSTGYLGKHLLQALVNRNYDAVALARNACKLSEMCDDISIIEAEATSTNSLSGCCNNIDVVISSLGITKQTDGLSYLDVDYQANLNLLNEAKRAGVKKFIYISVLNGRELTSLKICEAKEKFVEALEQSELDYAVIRPSGFFSDLSVFYNMAKKGRLFLFGDGECKSNPIYGGDLASVCVDSIDSEATEILVGGPEILSQNEIAKIAFDVTGNPVKITYIPDWVRSFAIKVLKAVLSVSQFGPVEFFLNVMVLDMTAPTYGSKTLKEEFLYLHNQKRT